MYAIVCSFVYETTEGAGGGGFLRSLDTVVRIKLIRITCRGVMSDAALSAYLI